MDNPFAQGHGGGSKTKSSSYNWRKPVESGVMDAILPNVTSTIDTQTSYELALSPS